MALRSEAVKLIKRGPDYGNLTRHFSGVSDAIDEALVTLENGGYISLPADYTRPGADWSGLGTLTDIETAWWICKILAKWHL